MIDFILALISTITSFNATYNATHLLPLSAALFTLLIFVVFVPLMMYVCREKPEQTIERITPILHVYDKAIAAAQISIDCQPGTYVAAQCERRVAEYKALRQPFADEMVLAYARLVEAQKKAAKKGAKQ